MDPHEHAHVCGCGAAAVDEIIRKGFGIDIAKALDPMNPDDFVKIVARLSRSMSRATRDTEVEILNKALDALDVDWPNLTKAQRNRVIAASRQALSPLAPAIIPPVEGELTIAGPRIMRGARRSVRGGLSATFRTAIGVNMSLRDQAISDHMIASQGLFITDEYGRRAAAHSRTAKRIVEAGVSDGIGRDAIAADLEAALGPAAGLRRSSQYWNVIAGTFANRARVYSAMSSMDEAGIERYVFEAVLDEATTDQCAYLHGRAFSVKAGLAQYAAVEAAEDPQEVKNIQPWVRVGRDENGNRILFTQTLDGERTLVAQVDQTRVGTVDNTGSFSRGMSTNQLQDAGISMPPLHGLCRSTIVADV